MTDLFVSEIWQYPIKGCAGQRVDSIEVGDYFGYDRAWAIVDEHGVCVAQRRTGEKGVAHRALAHLKPVVARDHMAVFVSDKEPLAVPLSTASTEICEVRVWGWSGKAVEVGGACSMWVTEYLNRFEKVGEKKKYRLVQVLREAKQRFAVAGQRGSQCQLGFADAYPILMISQASLDHLNTKIEGPPIGMERFRPNIVVDGCNEPHFEDRLRVLFNAEGVILRAEKQCDRCGVPAINQTDLSYDSRVLRALAEYRKRPDEKGNQKVWFGTNFTHHLSGDICTGDELNVL